MSSAAVNRPTDLKVKEADVNRKLQVYGIVSAFQSGKVPSNEQIDIALNSFLKSKAMGTPSTKLSTEGQALVADFRRVVEQAKYLLLTKNEGNLLQDFIWQSQQMEGGSAALPGAPVDKETAQQHGNQALEGLRTLGMLIISNGQFRKLLNDATILARDIAGDAASNAAAKVKPSNEQLNQIDHAAEDNVWHDTPDMSTGNIKNQIKSSVNKNSPIGKGDLKDAAGDASQSAHPTGSRDPNDVAALGERDARQGTSSGIDAAGGALSAAQTLKDRASENIPEDQKDKARNTKQRTKNYLSEKMPEERRDQTIWRLKKMVVEIQGHPDYMQAVNTLLDLAETYAGHANTVGQAGAGTVKGAHTDNALQNAEADLKTLIERFANYTSTDDLFSAINQIYQDADKDPELKSWFKHLDQYVRKCLKQQGYIMEDSASEEWDQLYDRGNFLLRDRYRNHTDRILDEFKFLGDQFDKDPMNKQFGQSLQKLFNDLGNDDNGKPTFKPHLVKDLSEVIIPAVFESVRYVPIPRIEYSDPMMDAVVENLVIESDNLMPNILEVANDNYFRWGRKKIANKNNNSVMLSVSGVQMDLRDVAYYVKKKQGFPAVMDQGICDVFLGGTGFSFKIKMATADTKDKQNFFKVDKVDVDVKNFNIKLKQSKHKILFALFKPIMLRVLRPALQKVLEKVIKEKMHELDSFAYQVKLEADKAQREIANDPENAPNIYSRYTSAAKNELTKGKRKAEAATEDKKVNVAVTKQDSIFPDIHLPGGISSKATEYKELARKGDKWESPVFSLGSAAASNDIPKTHPVQRKAHNVTEGGVRGAQNIGNTNSMTNQMHDPNAQHAGTTNGSAAPGFSNQVDQAFSQGGAPRTTGAGYTGTGLSGATGATGASSTGTTLGANNPVFTGSS